tara:strand:- start:190 stop:525 length:336 start_codon:yes stop_codon:yes gene_type:complete
MFPTFSPVPEMTTEPTINPNLEEQVHFVPFSECRIKVIPITWKFPYHAITKHGEENGFFVRTDKKPTPPSALKNRIWAFKRTQYQGMNGWYVYVQRFGNGFNPEDYSYVQS